MTETCLFCELAIDPRRSEPICLACAETVLANALAEAVLLDEADGCPYENLADAWQRAKGKFWQSAALLLHHGTLGDDAHLTPSEAAVNPLPDCSKN